jgi:hypothetical protein
MANFPEDDGGEFSEMVAQNGGRGVILAFAIFGRDRECSLAGTCKDPVRRLPA